MGGGGRGGGREREREREREGERVAHRSGPPQFHRSHRDSPVVRHTASCTGYTDRRHT